MPLTSFIKIGLNTLVEATTRKPHAISLNESDDLYARREPVPVHPLAMFDDVQPLSAADRGKSSEQLEHDTLSRIRGALYADYQS